MHGSGNIHIARQHYSRRFYMNKKLSFIFARRSVRNFQDKDVPQDMLDDILAAAMSAPSACAKDP